jgi:hypothetical protein
VSEPFSVPLQAFGLLVQAGLAAKLSDPVVKPFSALIVACPADTDVTPFFPSWMKEVPVTCVAGESGVSFAIETFASLPSVFSEASTKADGLVKLASNS